MTEHDDFDDRELAAALRGRADEMTGDVVDTDAALAVVRQRARTQRRWRATSAGALAAAAAALGVLAVSSVTGDDEVLRTPATAPEVASTPGPATTVTGPSTIQDPTTTPPTTLAPSTSGPAATSTAAPGVTAPPTVTGPPEPPSSTTTYDSTGGSITVRLAGGAISLVGDPTPAAGFSLRIDDNGPDRVRVRFEADDARSEIRVDLEGGVLVPTITND